MLTYSDIEKYTIINLLSSVMEADSIIHNKEVEYINNIMSEFHITPIDLEKLPEKDFLYNKHLFYNMEIDKQKEVKQMLLTMALADGIYDPREQEIIDSL